MPSYEPGAFGRNSHIPACLECRSRKAKVVQFLPSRASGTKSDIHPVFEDTPVMRAVCAEQPGMCVYVQGPSDPTDTRNRHLTAVETRLQMLETAIGKLFPSGEMDDITRALLSNELPGDTMPSVDLTEPMSAENSFATNAMLDNPFGASQLLPQESWSDVSVGMGSEGQESSLGSLLTEASSPAELVAPAQVERELVDNYFLRYHTIYPFVHETAFRSEFESPVKTFCSWPILENMVLAFGSWLAPNDWADLDKRYYAKAQRHLQQVPWSRREGLTIIQALLLLSDFAQKQGSPDESWHYIGTAVQKAIALNLHIEPSSPDLTELDKEIQRRVWWATYCSENPSRILTTKFVAPPSSHPLANQKPWQNPISPTAPFPTPTDDPTIYSGLIQQSSYHRMANTIYRRLLSSPNVTPQHVQEFEQMISTWHSNNSSFCTRLVKIDSVQDWHLTAWRRQSLCDQSLRLLVHRPLLLQWLKKTYMDRDSALSAEEHPAEVQCRAQGLKIARNTIGQISDSLVRGRYSRLTLSFTLYALFHALLVPVIHIKGNPSSPESISYIQDLEMAKFALKYLPVHGDALSQSFLIVLNRLFSVASQANSENESQNLSDADAHLLKPGDLRMMPTNIFGNEELTLLENERFKGISGLDFSEWLQS
ncbi:hypothetical protein N7474_005332 [Penicillium riverlandense]|uniref:uncharacterized protein n=1 Tax=Penicillium riverlandense TaxID=1903569 RepID=UPI002548A55A|nr:uncharacterized protein N7474_005332 [Penicillium riverlandense]KAJ5819741.1 hypothetical protein N7474_005332 [Penicillium riverlandense]